MKRVISLVLCLMMVLSLAVSASAAPGDYTITIKNNDIASADGHKYDAYQIFSGVLDSTGTILTEIQWGENVADGAAFIAALKAEPAFGTGDANLFKAAVTAADVAAVMATPANHTDAFISAFGKVATAQVSGTPVGSDNTMDTIEGKGYYYITIPADKPGYYLVKDDPTVLVDQPNKDVSDYILQVVGNVTVEHKGSIPTMDKSVSETGNTYGDAIETGIGETHYYRIVAELPDDYNIYDTYYLEFSDTMSSQLTYDQLVNVRALIRSSGTALVVDSGCYTVTPTVATAGAHLQVKIENTKAITSGGTTITLTPEDAIEIIYKAHVNETAVVNGNGIPNEATIIYSNNPNSDGKGESTPDETNVYPINLKLVKVDGKETTKNLTGAEFVLARTHNDGSSTHLEYATVDANGKVSGWVHHYEGDGCADDNTEHQYAVTNDELAAVLTTNSDGEISVGGLDTGSYELIEIKAPDGYNKLVEHVKISVSATIDEENDVIASLAGTTNQGTITFNPNSATVSVTIPNYKGDVLPSTGGIGTTLFYIFGGLMVAGAGILLVTKKRMGAEG